MINKMVKKNFQIILIAFLFLIPLINPLDEQLVISCGGDEELIIGCIGDEELFFIGLLSEEAVSAEETAVVGGRPIVIRGPGRFSFFFILFGCILAYFIFKKADKDFIAWKKERKEKNKLKKEKKKEKKEKNKDLTI